MVVQILDLDPAIKPRNRVVYSRPITVYQGIDNPIQIIVKNQDQKNVNLTGYALQVDIQDPDNQVTAYSVAVDYSNVAIGTGTFILDKDTVNSLEARIYKLTLKTIRDSDAAERPIYVDDNFGVPIDLIVKPAYYSTTVTPVGFDETVIDSGSL
jgi:hypothetical protein